MNDGGDDFLEQIKEKRQLVIGEQRMRLSFYEQHDEPEEATHE